LPPQLVARALGAFDDRQALKRRNRRLRPRRGSPHPRDACSAWIASLQSSPALCWSPIDSREAGMRRSVFALLLVLLLPATVAAALVRVRLELAFS
jgi:hypothetical protein